MVRFRGRVIRKTRGPLQLGPSGQLSNRQKYAHGSILIHEVLEDSDGVVSAGDVVSLRFSGQIPLWFRNKAWAEIAGTRSDKSTKSHLILDASPDNSFFLRTAALKAMLMKGVDVLKMREESGGEAARTNLDEALYNQKVVAVFDRMATLGLTYGDAEEEVEIVDLFSRRAESRGYADVATMIGANPYLLAEMGLRRVQDVVKAVEAAGLRLPEDTELYARIGSMVRKALSDGHSYLPFHQLVYRMLRPYWKAAGKDGKDGFKTWGSDVRNLLLREGITDLPHSSQAYLSIETVSEAEKYYQELYDAIEEGPSAKGAHVGVFFNRVIFAERVAAKRLAARVGPGTFSEDVIQAALQTGRENNRTPEQLQAIDNALRYRVSVLAGYAGTGKTAVLKDLCRTLTDLNIPVIVLAPSATAAANAGADIGGFYKPMTIHRFAHINYDDDWGETAGQFIKGEESPEREEPMPARLVVVDECSLCNVEVLAALLADLADTAPDAHLLLLGDPAQLPPIGPGGWFSHLVEGLVPRIPAVFLKQVFRSDAPLTQFASRIRDGEFRPEGSGVAAEKFDKETFLSQVKELLAKNEDILILTPDVQGALGTKELNALLQPLFNPDGELVGDTDYRVGDIVICRKNDYADGAGAGRGVARRLRHPGRTSDVYNGTRGTIVAYDKDAESITIEWRGAGENFSVPYNINELGHWIEPACAVTVHRAQGMQANHVIFVNGGRSISRSMMYTAVTRAQTSITLLGTGWAEAAKAPQKPLFSFLGFRVNRHLAKKDLMGGHGPPA